MGACLNSERSHRANEYDHNPIANHEEESRSFKEDEKRPEVPHPKEIKYKPPTIEEIRTDEHLQLAIKTLEREEKDHKTQTISLNRDIYNVYVVLHFHNNWKRMKEDGTHKYIWFWMLITYIIQAATYACLFVEFWTSKWLNKEDVQQKPTTFYEMFPAFATTMIAEESEDAPLLHQDAILWCSKTFAVLLLAIYLTKDISNYLTLIYCRDELFQQRFEDLRGFIRIYSLCMVPIYLMAMVLTVHLTMTANDGMLHQPCINH